jgi:plastocyanin
MTPHRLFAIRSGLLVLLFVVLTQDERGQAQNKQNKYACAEPEPAALCTARTMCGSTSEPCSVDVKRTASAASATPSISGAKGNSTFCVKVGTTVIWKSDTKHQGFVVDMGPNTPFGSTDDIIGGSDKSVTVVAKTPGCYKFSAGACLSGAIYGMCGNGAAQLVVLK